jgi:NADH dehydrogenase
MNDVVERVGRLTGRQPMAVPVPGALAVLGSRLASVVGIDIPLDQGQITMLEEGNVIRDPRGNALGQLGVTPTSLADGLARLLDALPEQLPGEGVGTLTRKRVWADIAGAALSPELLFERFRTGFAELTPGTMDVTAEPGTPTVPTEGATITMALPLRGNVQVRVEELTPRSMTLVTLEGHPLAGAVRFLSEQRGDDVRFEVQVYDRPSNAADWVMMRTLGQAVQLSTWQSLVQSVVDESGGRAPDGVQTDVESLDAMQAERVEAWLRDLVLARKRDESAAQTGRAARSSADVPGGDAPIADASH